MEAWPQEIDDTMMKVLADLMPKNQINDELRKDEIV